MSDPLPDTLPDTLSTTQLIRGRLLDRVLAAITARGDSFTITRYRRPIAVLGPVPQRIATDPVEVVAERMQKSRGKPAENSSTNSVTPQSPSTG